MSGVVGDNVGRTSGLVKAASVAAITDWVEIKELESDGSDADLTFVNGTSDVVLDSTYPIYCFQMINIHPETNSTIFTFQCSTDTGSSYGVTATSTFFRAQQLEDGSGQSFDKDNNMDFAQSTSFLYLGRPVLNDNDASQSGHLWLFEPSSTTFVKHFLSRASVMGSYVQDAHCAGYFNTTSAIDAIQFKFAADEIQGGKIKLFGLKDS